MVAKRAVLGDWWRFSSLVCRLPRVAQSVRGYRHEFHRDVQIFGGRRFWRAIRLQVDYTPNSPHHFVGRKPRGRCCGNRRCDLQRVRILGSSLREAVLRILGDCSLVPVPQGFNGATKPHTHNCDCVVRSFGLHLLSSMG